MNDQLNTTIGLAGDNSDLISSLVSVNEILKEKAGAFPYLKSPCASTIKLYQVLTVDQDKDLHLVRDRNMKVKDKRRQMASTSVRNLASRVVAVSYANFLPVVEKWVTLKGLPRGCLKLIDMLLSVTGSHFKPILPAYLLNEDCSSQYYCSGSIKGDNVNNGWSRVSTDSLVARNKDSMWTPDESRDTVCKGIRIKFACGGSAGGFVYPICILVSNLSKDELPSNDFKVVPIKGLTINGHMDPRSNEVGYLCLVGCNVAQSHFFNWFYEEITCKTVKAIRSLHNPNTTPLCDDEEIPVDQRVVMWGDSDIPYLQQMMSPIRIESSLKKGISFAKIGAKTTENVQPMDLGPFFKVMKVNGKHMTSVGQQKSLTHVIDFIMKKLRKDGILKLAHMKEISLKDLLITAPEMMASAFSESSIIDSFVSAGMLDSHSKVCPDLFGIIDAFKIDWSKVTGGKKWFLSELPGLICEMYSEGEISEQYYDDNHFPLDKDHRGTVWRLKSNADHLTRSKVLYHPSIIAKNNEDIRLCVESQTSKEVKVYQDAKAMYEVNKDLCIKLLAIVQDNLNQGNMDTVPALTLCTLEMFERVKVHALTAFYRCRMQSDLKMKFVCPAKGTIDKVRAGEVDKKQRSLVDSMLL